MPNDFCHCRCLERSRSRGCRSRYRGHMATHQCLTPLCHFFPLSHFGGYLLNHLGHHLGLQNRFYRLYAVDGCTVLLRLLARVEPAHGNERPAQCDIDRRRHSVVIVFVHVCKDIKKSRNGSNFMDIFLKARSVCGSPSDQRAISSLPSPQMKESSPRLS